MMAVVWWLIWMFGLAPAFANPEGWSTGPVASGAGQVLNPADPLAVELPTLVGELITKPTALYYFSPTCPHCQAVIPEIQALSTAFEDVQWVGVASAHSSPDMVKAFKQAYGVEFPIVHDVDGLFSQAVGARATPNVYVTKPMEPTENSTEEEASEKSDTDSNGQSTVLLTDMYLPYSRGMAGIFKLCNGDPTKPFEHFDGYQGNRVCISCHVEEGKSYMMTHHAQAYYTLYKIDKVDDPKCVGCHVVGMGEQGGFELGDHDSPLAGVGCESCHSAGGGHDGTAVDAKESCVGCHDEEHSIHFSVEKGLPHIDHFAAVGMSDADVQKRIDEISDGTAEKPLLSFPKGRTVGSERCMSCHDGIHPEDPHSKAVQTLKRKERKDTGCLTCHATPTEVSSMMSTNDLSVDHFRTDEGVGCESCHGAGEAHAESPSPDNIVGLGDSCPVCVLESICTSCHTPKWDPNWSLEERIKLYTE